MYLRIDETLEQGFIVFVLQRMRTWLRLNVNYDMWKVFETYFNILHSDKKETTAKHIFLLGINNLEAISDDRGTLFQFNPNIKLEGYNEKLIDVLKFMNYGNSEVPPYPIFEQMFNQFADDFQMLYNIYYSR